MFQKSEHMLRVSDEIEFAFSETRVEVLIVDSSSMSGKVSSSSGQSRAASGQNTLPDTNFANISQLRNRFVCCLKIIFHKILDSNIFCNLLPSTVVDCNFRAKA